MRLMAKYKEIVDVPTVRKSVGIIKHLAPLPLHQPIWQNKLLLTNENNN